MRMSINHYKHDMLCSNIYRGIFGVLKSSIEILDGFNYVNQCNLKLRNITIVKIIPNFTCRSIKIYYVIRGSNQDQMFFDLMKSAIIAKLKKRIRKSRFPLLKFVYDTKYDASVNDTIAILRDLEPL